jgi:GNAT superfamily N-acetyltransferase
MFTTVRSLLEQFPAQGIPVRRPKMRPTKESESGFRCMETETALLWLPPGVHPDDDAILSLIRESVPEQRRDDMFPIFELMGSYHPDEPHWHLPLIGVEPTQQRKGYGSALLKHALRICDKDGVSAYLESSNPENIPLYRRHGFEVLGTIQVGSSPPVTPMLRRPRAGRRGQS